MTPYVFNPPPSVSLAVANSAQRFPVGRIFCIGRNYAWQPDEPPPQALPSWFMKPPSALAAADQDLVYPPETRDFCHEIEWVVAIGRGGRRLLPADVEAGHIWGYGVGLDLTRRDLQQQAKRIGASWEAAKAFDHAATCTPLVPASLSGHPRRGAIWLDVNGQRRQSADLASLLWPVPELVAMLSRSVALAPGDLIYTGTPAGVDALQIGDTVSGGIEGFGHFSTTVRASAPNEPT
ncbi:fumarylacetoacetate hydrolase family protein [Curvibacter sp. RS43]|uniref:Fumarylacetoacetate hydrolase family protein n=1 Tax=Curvibacter microcysteis TaxID=3026419 RepID=A0ABT5MDU9_9BURK|nr:MULTISPECIES: fumarylacetoacetate hydrolase family protein [unclassified Curvibacter]MDD0809588.1 fumarylacetoacetate hydrolase family protein [Curvibacter sp. RS43]MDD0814758.1 fumarylacetoacetate hydrolase family protein [Curvibacter sp. HBC28]